MPLIDSSGHKIIVKAFGVNHILADKIGCEEVKFKKEDFPGLSKAVLVEAAKALPKRFLDILVGNTNLGLQPVCRHGFGCKDCKKGRCLYKSRFGSGFIPLGSFGDDQPLVNVVRHVALTKIAPVLEGMFFQGEALGVSTIERCTSCKL